jgi:hypothetical protein
VLHRQFARPIHASALAGEIRGCHGLPMSSYGLVTGRDPWGEAFSIGFICDRFQIWPTGRTRAVYVRMSPEMRRLVARTVTGAALRP